VAAGNLETYLVLALQGAVVKTQLPFTADVSATIKV